MNRGLLFIGVFSAADPVQAAPQTQPFVAAELGLPWVIPFLGMLASLAVIPLLAPRFWHRRYGAVALFWALAFLAPFAARFGAASAAHELLHTFFLEYLPFIALIGSLFTIAGGLHLRGNLRGAPVSNLTVLAIGTALASMIGTTGASMILIRPLLRANLARRHNAHVFIFFIFLVSNIGGALSPIGDPPLFLGYLNGVDFFWPLKNLAAATFTVSAFLLAAFFAIDSYYYRCEEREAEQGAAKQAALRLEGITNIPLLLILIGAVIASGSLTRLGHVTVFGIDIAWANLLRDGVLVVLGLASLMLTPAEYRRRNRFGWEPVVEVAKLFAAIFVTIIPVIAMLKAGPAGPFAPIFPLLGDGAAPNNFAYFWLTGILSAFLDNAPTYLVFFNAAAGDATALMGPMATTLAAISAGAVFMGAFTYIGNAPNFMVRTIAEEQGIGMPGFFGYMAWSALILLPCFVVTAWLFFR